MINILNSFSPKTQQSFRPTSPDDYFALRLAVRLAAPAEAAHYALLVSEYGRDALLSAYQKVLTLAVQNVPLARIFREHLPTSRDSLGEHSLPHPRLLAVRLERRTVAVALFCGTRFIGRRVLHLSSNVRRAESSTAAFIGTVLRENDCESLAIETTSGEIHRSLLHAAILTQCRATAVSVWEISRAAVTNALAHPPVRSRRELRGLIGQIYPLPGLRRGEICAMDALALGLYVQTERQFASEF